ncbi:GerAB/ArcD/ProY family transporter [Bacillus sp. ISL-40]|uniref:GerAB/ArcD/ProY family transporter n=1 Tax=Bacillus sp. ISL-40 TaxID=2819126 RepID=UPI001BEAF24D|nr:GerAB/ArcD/ProY family transporter [Bacillus sp. ISL-40]MBT2700867.1 GerAB/ArcD/ProY family transporter [Bacillus sp. ISL-40]
MVQSKLQPIQLFVLIVLFEIGSSVVVGLGLDAKQDAWLVILLSMIGGIGLFSLYVYLYLQFPDLSLTNFLEKIVGKVIGRILAIIYICLFLYIAARILRTFGELLLTTVLYETPISVVMIVMMLTICFGCYLGFEVIARTAEIMFPWFIFFGFLFILFTFFSDLPKLENLQPVLEAGWKPVLKSAFPSVLSFPFGETIVFTIFFPLLNKQKDGVIAGYLALVFSGILLIIVTTIIISVIGSYTATKSPFALMETIGRIQIGEVFQRLDPIGIILLIIGGYFKITIFLYAAVEGFSNLIRMTSINKFMIPLMAASIIAMSILMADNSVEHREGAAIVPYILYIPLFMVIPFLLVVIVIIKKKITKRKQKRHSTQKSELLEPKN